ncbi:MAG: hypothetical protein EOP47_26015 [Sphingobacteriaceae bacterium]|nr:MAG: hypothetical protein EOP47_26015 [Sphingobacteriaceae bacterium]
MKSIKTFVAILALLVVSSTTFAKPLLFVPPSSLTVHVDRVDQGVSPINPIYHDYLIRIYITDTATPGYANRLTLPGDFSITSNVTDTTPGGSGLSGTGTFTIAGGTNNFSYITTDRPNMSFNINSTALSQYSYMGIPIVANMTPNYLP